MDDVYGFVTHLNGNLLFSLLRHEEKEGRENEDVINEDEIRCFAEPPDKS